MNAPLTPRKADRPSSVAAGVIPFPIEVEMSLVIRAFELTASAIRQLRIEAEKRGEGRIALVCYEVLAGELSAEEDIGLRGELILFQDFLECAGRPGVI